MPNPRKGEKKPSFIKRCVPILIGEGRKSDQAVAICNSIWNDRNKKKENSMDKKLFRNDISRGIIGVDEENEIIKGFAVVTKGITHDKRGEFDSQELENIVRLGNESELGIKSRFGHPNMSSTALGTFIGRTKNFRKDGDVVRADLHIDKTAHETPDGDLAKYVMELAKSDPAAFGTSMVIHWEAENKENDGKKKEEDENCEVPFIRATKLFAVDVVDDPAANNGMFGEFFSGNVKFSAEMTEFLDNFLNSPDALENVLSFLSRYGVYREYLKEKGVGKMLDFKDLTVELIKENRSDLYESIFSAGKESLSVKKEEKTEALEVKEEKTETLEVKEEKTETLETKEEKTEALETKEEKVEVVENKEEVKVEEKSEDKGSDIKNDEILLQKEKEIEDLKKENFDLSKKLKETEDYSNVVKAELAVEKKWVKLSEGYKREDFEEIKKILLKAELGEKLSSKEADSLISKKIGDSLPSSTSSVLETSNVVDDVKKKELAKLGGIRLRNKK